MAAKVEAAVGGYVGNTQNDRQRQPLQHQTGELKIAFVEFIHYYCRFY